MHDYAIGLDIGVTSVGWSIIALDEGEKPCGIIDFGSRIFDAAEHPKTGASLALPRREARSARRRLRRHRHRNERIRTLLLSEGLVDEKQLLHLFDGQLEDIYALRVKALDNPITPAELSRILLHISQRRGFKSNRKNPSTKEDGKLLEAVNENKARMEANGYRTAGEMYLKDEAFAQYKRNKGGKYPTTVTRSMAEDEVRQIFAAQRKLQQSFATEKLEEAYLEILLSQRSFDDGPGSGPYAGNQIERMIGTCTFEKGEKRAAKATYSFEYFTLLEKINHIRLNSPDGTTPLTQEQRRQIIEAAHKTDNLDFSRIRKLLQIPAEQTFNLVRYEKDASQDDCEKKTKVSHLKAYHKMRTTLDKVEKGRITQLSHAQRDLIGRTLSIYKTSDKIRPALLAGGLTEADVDALEAISGFSGFGHLSTAACCKIIPFLEEGMNYNEACVAAGYDFKGHSGTERSLYLDARSNRLEDLTSPVVRRSIAQTIKVVNAIIRRQGERSPMFVNIELARELSRDFSERKKMEREMEQNRVKNEKALHRIQSEFGKDSPTGQDLVKLKLYEEQGGICPYSGKQMSLSQVFSDNDYAEVDHILPYSISFDDSYKNKVLVLAEENRNKGNRLPLQYLQGKKRDDFIVRVNTTIRDYRKRLNLLKERFTEEDEARFKERNLQDTKTASRFLYNYINDTLQFAPSTGRKKRVTAVNGAVTSYMRKRWGIGKIRENGDLHHAVDAVVVACTTDSMIQQISRYAQFRECEYMQQDDGSYAVDCATGEVLRRFPYPWSDFRRELEARLSSNPTRAVLDQRIPFYVNSGEPIGLHTPFVSRAPRRKVSGAAHKDTVKGRRLVEHGYVLVKRPLTDLKLDKDGGIADYYDPSSDRLLYDALCSRLKAYGGDASKAFAEPFHKPKSDGTPGPLVNKVKLMEKTTLNVLVQDGTGVADHDTMVRIDVFYVENDGYYFIPIYVADTLKKELPNRACVAHKPYEQWKEMKPEDFVFSLYPNDLIRVTHRKGFSLALERNSSSLPPIRTETDVLLYYKGADRDSVRIEAITHDGAYRLRKGIKGLERLEKYTVDVLGVYYPVHHESRQPFTKKEKRGDKNGISSCND